MKALLFERYGRVEDLRLAEVPKPGEVLVRVMATSINSWDWELVAGRSMARLGNWFKPPDPILGADISGVVEGVGPEVTRLKPGMAVFGDISESGWGGLAEYVCVREAVLLEKAESVSHSDGAAIGQAGILALKSLKGEPALRPGDKVLINGGGGGVGTLAIQIAKHRGAEVTGVDAAHKLETMRDCGADHVLDYRQSDFTRTGQRYNRIVDPVGKRRIGDYKRALTENGVLRLIGGRAGLLMRAGVSMLFGGMDARFALTILRPDLDDLATLQDMVQSGTLKPVIDRAVPLEDAAAAIAALGAGAVCGKAIILPNG